ncbi:hypothetical protein FQN60_015439, partial [Etheostoma spectabile]
MMMMMMMMMTRSYHHHHHHRMAALRYYLPSCHHAKPDEEKKREHEELLDYMVKADDKFLQLSHDMVAKMEADTSALLGLMGRRVAVMEAQANKCVVQVSESSSVGEGLHKPRLLWISRVTDEVVSNINARDDPFGYYYVMNNMLGPDGDFITSLEISPIFGELLGVWLVSSDPEKDRWPA